MPRKSSYNRTDDLSVLRHVEPKTVELHSRALESFDSWLEVNGTGLSVNMLVHAPSVCDMLVAEFGRWCFRNLKPLYSYLMLITAIMRVHVHMKTHLSLSWNVATNWRIKEPVLHRLPIPTALAKALFALSHLCGFQRFAGCAMLAFYGPGRIGEVLKCKRKDLVLPSDMLFEPRDMVLLQFLKPKSRFRGGAHVQHLSIKDQTVGLALEQIFSPLSKDEPLYPFSHATFRNRWDLCMRRLGIPNRMFTPGGLRGGGAVAAHLNGVHISDILWRMRLKHQTTLEHYLQEVSAAVSLHSLPQFSRTRISTFCLCFDRLFGL